MMRARVPKDRQIALTKPKIAIEEIDRVIAFGLRFNCVLADTGYGSSSSFRQALSDRGLLWAVGLTRRQTSIQPLALNRVECTLRRLGWRRRHWAVIASLIGTCKLIGVERHSYLADIISRIVNGHPQSRINELLPWSYRVATTFERVV